MASNMRSSSRTIFQALQGHCHSQQPSLRTSFLFARFMCTGQSSKLFVGGLSWQTGESELRDAFSSFGEVTEARIIIDRETGRSKGFGFVSFASISHADTAMKTMNGRDLNGKTLRVNFATPRSGFGSGGYGGGGGGYGGGGSGYGGGDGYGGGSSSSSYGVGGGDSSYGGVSFGASSSNASYSDSYSTPTASFSSTGGSHGSDGNGYGGGSGGAYDFSYSNSSSRNLYAQSNVKPFGS